MKEKPRQCFETRELNSIILNLAQIIEIFYKAHICVSAFNCEIAHFAFNSVKKLKPKAGPIGSRGMPCRAVNAASLGIWKISERARSCVGKCYSSQKFKRVARRILKTCSNLALRVSGVRAGARVRASPSSGGKSEKKKKQESKSHSIFTRRVGEITAGTH
jgi:hypothetical protein